MGLLFRPSTAWLGGDCDSNSAKVKLSLLDQQHLGLIFGMSGFGERVRAAEFTKVGEFLMEEDWANYTSDDGFFEIAKVPVWVSAEDLLTRLNTHAKWETKFVREVHGTGGVKTFILRATAAPEVDSVRIGDALLPVKKRGRNKEGGKSSESLLVGHRESVKDDLRTRGEPR